MKKLKLMMLILGIALFSASGYAAKNGQEGGGGSNLKSDFRKRVEKLILRLNQMNDPLASTYAKAFQETIDDPAFKIDVVEVLIDPLTSKALANQRSLYAYGVRNYIQLKSTPSEDEGAESWEKKFREGGNIDPDVFHEMAWAATGNDDDRDYQISIGKLKLQEKPAEDSRSQCINTKSSMASITKEYRLIYQSCSSPEIRNDSRYSEMYESYKRLARKTELLYQKYQEICYKTCEDTFVCGYDLSGACLD